MIQELDELLDAQISMLLGEGIGQTSKPVVALLPISQKVVLGITGVVLNSILSALDSWRQSLDIDRLTKAHQFFEMSKLSSNPSMQNFGKQIWEQTIKSIQEQLEE